MKTKNKIPKDISVTLHLSPELADITGFEHGEICASEDASFFFFLRCLFMDYPEIEQRYPPGVLAFDINGAIPKTDTVLKEGDRLSFWADLNGFSMN